MFKPFQACINFLGGKRNLISEIFEHVPDYTEAPVFADGFFGGGSVSLFAKSRGHRVLCNDLSLRSFLSAQALIQNSEHKIEDEDILRLFEETKHSKFLETNYVPKVFTRKNAQFVDTAIANIQKMPDYKKPLMLHLMLKYIISSRPFGRFTFVKSTKNLDERNFEYFEGKSYSKQNLGQIQSPLDTLRRLAKQVNYAIVDNGQKNEAYHGDVFDFIKKIKADVVYFDPPYSESISYEEMYNVLDEILHGKKIKPSVSVFTKKDAIDFQDKLFAASTHIKHWVISMGQTNSKTGISPEELLKIVQKYKKHAKMRVLKHKWMINNMVKKKQSENVEYIIYTYEKQNEKKPN